MEKKKRSVWHVVICVGLLCLIWGGYLFGINTVSQKIEEILEDDFKWVVQVDGVRTEKNEFVIDGFAFKLNEDAKEGTFDIILYNLDTGEFFFPKMEYMERKDVNDYFLCEYDYTESGFTAKIDENELDLKENNYEVLIRPKGKRKPYRFTTYLVDGDLMYTNPKTYVPLNVVGTGLEKIIEDGCLRVYSPENQVYVYQYNDCLYWFFEKNYPHVDTNGNFWLQYIAYTTQKDRLPLEQIEKKRFWSNCNFSFLSKELKQEESTDYRVAMCELVTSISISKIKTGHKYNDDEWKISFRPWYQFGTK